MLGFIEYDLAHPEFGASQITSVIPLQQSLFQSLLDGAEDMSLAGVKEPGDLRLGLATPGVICSMGELVNTVYDGIGCQREGKLLPHRMMDDGETRLQPEGFVREMFAYVRL